MLIIRCACGASCPEGTPSCPACHRVLASSSGTLADDPSTQPRFNDTQIEPDSFAEPSSSGTLVDQSVPQPSAILPGRDQNIPAQDPGQTRATWIDSDSQPNSASQSSGMLAEFSTGTLAESALPSGTQGLGWPFAKTAASNADIKQTAATLGLSPQSSGPLESSAPAATLDTPSIAATAQSSDRSESFDASGTLAHDLGAGTGTLVGNAATEAPSERTGRTMMPASFNYELLSELGRGAMGVVYRARQRGLNRLVALKMILSGGMAGKAELARFQAEAEAVAAIDHPNIVKIYEVGEYEGKPFFSLEFVTGGTLEGRTNTQPQDPKQAARIVTQIARGMAFAHRKGIVHRDLKPANVLLALPEGADPKRIPLGDCVAKVSDFGLVKKVDDDSARTRDGAIMGTPSFMAPEQAMGRNKEVGPPADIHAIGGILYDLLTGSPPFRGSTVMATIQQVISRDPAPPRDVLDTVPLDLSTICLKCLEKDPQKRYLTADLLADDLERYLRNEPILARPSTTLERTVKWVRRKPMHAALAAAAGLIFMLILGSGFLMAGFEAEKARMAQAETEREQKEAETQKRLRERADELRKLAEERRVRAEVNFRQACQAVDSLLDRIGGARLAHEPRLEMLRQELLQQAAQFYRKFQDQQGDDPLVKIQQAAIYKHLASVSSLLGDKKEAEESLRAALARLEKLHEPEFEVQKFGELLEVRQLLGSLLVEQRRLPEARALLTEALAQISNKPAQVSNEIAQLRLDLADLERKEGHPAKALPIIDSAISDLTHLAEIESGAKSTPAILRLGNALMVRARLAEEAGDRKIARSSLDLALSKADKLLVAAPALPEALILRAVGLTARADLMRDENTPMARADMELASTALEGLVRDYPATPEYRQQQAALLTSLANFHLAQGDSAQSEAILDRALAVQEDLAQRVPWVPEFRRQVAGTLNDRGILFATSKRLDRAEKSYTESEKRLRDLVKTHPNAADYQQELARTLLNLAALRLQQKQPQLASPLADEAIGLLTSLVARFPNEPARKIELARSLGNAAVQAQQAGAPDKAASLDRSALDLLASLPPASIDPDAIYLSAMTGNHLAELVEVRDGMKSAEPIYQKALADFRNLVALPGARPEFIRQIIEVLLEYGFRQIRADAVEKARGAWTEALAAIRSPAGTEMADEIADLATKLAINLAGIAQLDHQQARFDKAHEMLALARDLRRDRLVSSPTVGQGALALARLELLEGAWREERNNKKEAIEASVRAGEQLVRGLSAKGEVVPELTQVAAEIAKVLAGAPSGGKASMVLASMVKESLDSSNTPASLAMAEVLAKATRLDEAWELLMRLDAKGIKDPDWMKKTFPVPPPAGPRRDLHARWLAAPGQ